MVFIVILILGTLSMLVASLSRASLSLEMDRKTAEALAQAKEALIGYAAIYRDAHPSVDPITGLKRYDKMFGYLPCPDTDNDGIANTCSGAKNVSLIGRLPWKTLGLPPLRDGSGECLWYALSGTFKNKEKTDAMNWDTPGQFNIREAGGASLASDAMAVIFSPRQAIGSQDRSPSGSTECGGNTVIAAYLEGADPIYTGTLPGAGAHSTFTLATAASIASGSNNDRGLWITANEIFERIKRRRDFATDIANLLNDIRDQAGKKADCSPDTALRPPAASPVINEPGLSGKSIGFAPDIEQSCISSDQARRKTMFDNWRNNVLYAVCPGGTACLTVNGDPNCAAAAIFSGEKTNGRLRPSDKAADYLEGANLSAFAGGSAEISGSEAYDYQAPSADIAVCIPPLF